MAFQPVRSKIKNYWALLFSSIEYLSEIFVKNLTHIKYIGKGLEDKTCNLVPVNLHINDLHRSCEGIF